MAAEKNTINFRPKTAMYIKDGLMMYSDDARRAMAIRDAEEFIGEIKGEEGYKLGKGTRKKRRNREENCDEIELNIGQTAIHGIERSSGNTKQPVNSKTVEVSAANVTVDGVLLETDAAAQAQHRHIETEAFNQDIVGVQVEAHTSAKVSYSVLFLFRTENNS